MTQVMVLVDVVQVVGDVGQSGREHGDGERARRHADEGHDLDHPRRVARGAALVGDGHPFEGR